MHSWAWSPIELDILRALATRVRLMTASQIAAGFYRDGTDPERNAAEALARLEQAELLRRQTFETHPLLSLSEPLLAWKPGQRAPSESQFKAVAQTAQERWSQNYIALEVFSATKRTSSLLGAFTDARNPKSVEITHDLHLTSVYLLYRQKRPELATAWLGEAAFPKMGFEIMRMKDPDAFLVDRTGMAMQIVEFAGSYDVDHLRAFHEHCAGGAAARLADSGWTDTDNPFVRLYHPSGTSYELW